MMLVTIKVPDNTARIEYAVTDEAGYVGECHPVTAGQLVRVEPDPDAEMIDLGEV